MIPPALTSEEWTRRITPSEACDRYDEYAVIAVTNHGLRDDDPRKITWAMVDDLREAYRIAVVMARHEQDAGVTWEAERYKALAKRYYEHSDALQGYLPPRP